MNSTDNKARRPLEARPLGALIGHLSRLHRQRMDAGAVGIGMQPGYRRLHFELITNDGCTQRELAERTGLSAPTVSIALGKMEKDGLIRREVDPEDSRKIRVRLTEAGMALDRAMRGMTEKNENLLTGKLTPEEQAELRRLLLKMISSLQDEEQREEK